MCFVDFALFVYGFFNVSIGGVYRRLGACLLRGGGYNTGLICWFAVIMVGYALVFVLDVCWEFW